MTLADPPAAASAALLGGAMRHEERDGPLGARDCARQAFFDSISTERVKRVFSGLGCVHAVALALAELCTLDDKLPQGSSASPVIANLVCRELDRQFVDLAGAHGCRYSRYADDITISGEKLPRSREVRAIIEANGFRLRDGKCRVQWRGRAQYVTGLSITDPAEPNRPRLPRAMKRKLRAELHFIEKFGIENHLHQRKSKRSVDRERDRISGLLTFMIGVEPESARKFHEQWIRIDEAK